MAEKEIDNNRLKCSSCNPLIHSFKLISKWWIHRTSRHFTGKSGRKPVECYHRVPIMLAISHQVAIFSLPEKKSMSMGAPTTRWKKTLSLLYMEIQSSLCRSRSRQILGMMELKLSAKILLNRTVQKHREVLIALKENTSIQARSLPSSSHPTGQANMSSSLIGCLIAIQLSSRAMLRESLLKKVVVIVGAVSDQ